MKQLFLMILLLGIAFNCSAQISGAPDGSDLTITKKSWHFVKPDYSSIENSDPFAANDAQREFSRAVKQNTRENEIRSAQGLPREPPPTRPSVVRTSSDYLQTTSRTGNYVYQIEIRNAGQKTIRSVTWDYVFFDIIDKREAGRRRFVSSKNIRAGKTGKLSENSNLYPTLTIDAARGDKKFETQYSEQIFIQRIQYSDGTFWQAAAN